MFSHSLFNLVVVPGGIVDLTTTYLHLFIVVKFINKLNKKAEDPKDGSVSTPKNIELLTKMNSLLEEQNNLLKSQKGKK